MDKQCCEIGSFDCSVRINKRVFVDKCLQDEIIELLSQGIKTMASCCGHKTTDSIIGVSDDSVQKMKELGYKIYPKYENTFYSKNKNRTNENINSRGMGKRKQKGNYPTFKKYTGKHGF